jgi:hypothetical protein
VWMKSYLRLTSQINEERLIWQEILVCTWGGSVSCNDVPANDGGHIAEENSDEARKH